MFPLKKHQSTLSQSDAPVKRDIVVSVESQDLVGYAVDLKERFGITVFHQQLGLETQQLDESEREAMMDRIKETINDYDQRHPKTGSLHVYLLDGQGLGTANDAVVGGLIASSLRNPSRTMAALIPEDVKASKPDDLSPASMLKQLADHVLASQGVRVVVGRAALEAFLAGDESVVYGTPMAESFKDEAAEGEPAADEEKKKLSEGTESLTPSTEADEIYMALGVASMVGCVLLGINAIREGIQNRGGGKEARDERAFRDNVRKRFTNLDWVKKQTLVTGPISPDGIVKSLHLTKASDYPHSITSGIQSVRTWRAAYTPRAISYLKFLVANQTRYVDDGDAESLVAFANTIRTQQDPRDTAPMKFQGFLSSVISAKHPHGRSMLTVGDSAFTGQLQALDAAGIVEAANLTIALMEEAKSLVDSVNDIAEETLQLNTEVGAGDGDEWRAGSAASKAQWFLQERYGERRGRSEYVWPAADLSRILEAAAKGLGHWIDRSIKKK